MPKIKVTPERLCQEAGLDPDEKITTFVAQDLADVLVEAGWKAPRIIKLLKKACLGKLANALCDASHWTEVFQDWAEMEEKEE